MRPVTHVSSHTLRPGLVLEYLGNDIALLDASGNESGRVSGEAADVVRALLSQRHATATELGASDEVIAELLAKGFVDAVRTPSRRGVIAAGAAGFTALALPSHVAAESVGGSGGLARQIPGAPTNLSVTNGDSAVQISFTPGATGGGTITNYEYSTDGGVTWVALSPADATSPVVITATSNTGTPLVNGTTYSIMLRARNSENEIGDQSSAVSATPVVSSVATGGSTSTNVVSEGIAYRVHYFAEGDDADFVLEQPMNLDYLVVGGGGAGGHAKTTVVSSTTVQYGAGGGGAGGMRAGTFVSLAAGAYPVTIGQGGGTSTGNTGNTGEDSTFHTVTSAGGGGGSSYLANALNGGSGGGGGPTAKTGGTGNTPAVDPSQGSAGGTGGTTAGAGGGGAGGIGSNATANTSGQGGEGVESSITGEPVLYAVGGNGGNIGSGGAAGGPASGDGGGGGGGGWRNTLRQSASAGTSGTVIVRYAIPQSWDLS